MMKIKFILDNIHPDAIDKLKDEINKIDMNKGPITNVHLENTIKGSNIGEVSIHIDVNKNEFLTLLDKNYAIVLNFIYNLIDALYLLTGEANKIDGGINRDIISNLDLEIDTEYDTILEQHFHVTCDFENTGDDYEDKYTALVDIINNYHYANEEYSKGGGDANIFQLAHSIDEGVPTIFKMIAKGDNDMSCASILFNGLKQTTIGTLLLIHDLESNEHFSKLVNTDLIYLPNDEENGDKVYRLFIDDYY